MAHKADTQKPTLQKSLPVSTLPGHTLLRLTGVQIFSLLPLQRTFKEIAEI
jgi:hypothetical protein